jgi:hypothetical protein
MPSVTLNTLPASAPRRSYFHRVHACNRVGQARRKISPNGSANVMGGSALGSVIEYLSISHLTWINHRRRSRRSMPQRPRCANLVNDRDSAMNEQFQVLPMDRQNASAAYPLVYLHDASITADQWLRFVRRRCRTAFDCRVITIEQPFRSATATTARCPTAKALKGRVHPLTGKRCI